MLQRVKEQTGIVPQALATRPTLGQHLTYEFNLFYELSEFRNYSGMGEPRPITLDAFLGYASLWQFTRLEAQESWSLVRLIDNIWLRLYVERQKTDSKKQKTKAS